MVNFVILHRHRGCRGDPRSGMSEAADVLGVLRVRFTRLDERIERRLDLADEMTAPAR
jgi:hypothetical protein